MDIFCCRINNLISFVLIIYFILMVVGPSISNRRVECLNQIHEVFRVPVSETKQKRIYFRYAILNLRFLKPKELEGYIQNLGREPEENSFFVLWDGNHPHHGYINTEEYSYKYYQAISDKFKLGTTLSPEQYCEGYSEPEKTNCEYSLKYYGFIGEMEGIIKYAYSSIVLLDITTEDVPFRRDMAEPTKIYAEHYLIHLAVNVTVHVIYFILMVIGPSSSNRRVECLQRIEEIFKLTELDVKYKKEYFQQAFLYLRYLNSEEKAGYLENLGPNPPESSKYALWYGNVTRGYIIEEEFSHGYYERIKNRYDASKVKTPTEYCGTFPENQRNKCRYSLDYYRFAGDKEEVIRYAYLNLVLLDITTEDVIFRYDIEIPDKSYAKMYMIDLALNVSTNRGSMIWPRKFCPK